MVMMKYFKQKLKMIRMILSFVRVSSEVIQVRLNYMFEVMERKFHSLLKICFDVFKAERHIPICKCIPMTNKFHLTLILRFNLDLIVA
jgi:hypothetical protein